MSPPRPANLAATLLRFVEGAPEAWAAECPASDGSRKTLSRNDLLTLASAAAAALRAAGARPGDRIILAMSTSAELLGFFWGCQLIGATCALAPALLASPGRASAEQTALSSLCDLVEPSVLVVDNPDGWPRNNGRGSVVLGAKAAAKADGAPQLINAPDGDNHPAWIQFTSGSTGAPKGCVLSHAAVIENAAALVAGCNVRPGDVGVAWLPLHHDMGLMSGVVTPVMGRAATCLSTPSRFLANPLTWLADLARHPRTHTAVPNFALALTLQRLQRRSSDLRGLEGVASLTCGAEPIDPAVVRRFLAATAPLGLRPEVFHAAYGLGEATVLATGLAGGLVVDRVDAERMRRHAVAVPASDPTLTQEIVSVGRPPPGSAFRIVGEKGEPLGDRLIGHIQLQSPSLMSGYFRDRGATEATFDGAWLKTGDLGYSAAGSLFVTGRARELIIVGGRNVAPVDVESVAALRTGLQELRIVAFGLPGRLGTEEIHMIAEVRAPRDAAALRQALRQACHEVSGVFPASVILAAPGAIPRTTSGKKKRAHLAEAVREGWVADVDA